VKLYTSFSFSGGLQDDDDDDDDDGSFPRGCGVSGGAAASTSVAVSSAAASSSGGAGNGSFAAGASAPPPPPAAAAATTEGEHLHWRCAAHAAGVKHGDTIIAVNETNVERCSLDELITAISLAFGRVHLVLQRAGSSVDVYVKKKAGEGLFLSVKAGNEHNHGPFCVSGIHQSTSVPQQPAPSKILIHEIAVQIHGINHKQCEATQWLTSNDRTVLREFIKNYKENGGFYASTVKALSLQMRRSVVRLIDAASYPGWNDRLWLNSAAESMLNALLDRADAVHLAAATNSGRTAILDSDRDKNRYDPSTGVAYHFTQSGRRLYYWPKYRSRSEKGCTCRKPDWMRIAPKGRSEGVLTFMCSRSGVVLGNTMLTGHEGCKDAGSALYSFHPMRVGQSRLKSVVCDTPCMHATYMNTRAPKEFDEVQWTGDRFHIKPHTCRAIYDPDEYAIYDHINTSMIEQWHAVMDNLTTTVKGSTLAHAMFLLQTLEDDHYRYQCRVRDYPAANQCWK
jgi:hypothetical protein